MRLRADAAEIERGLYLLVEEGATFEIRAIATRRGGGGEDIISGYFRDVRAAAALVARTDHDGVIGWYVTINPVDPALYARRANRLDRVGKDATTKEHHVAARRRFFLDVDPCRPTGISSTDAEHAAALKLARSIASEIEAMGWPAPSIADSGNGAHVIPVIDLPGEGDLIERVLAAAAVRWSGEVDGIALKVDTSTANASRITKLYGTPARKGDDIAERPHRMSAVLSTPEELRTVPRELLEAFAGPRVQPAKPARAPGPRTGPAIDAAEWLARHGIGVKTSGPWNGQGGSGTLYELEVCPYNAEHGERGEAFVIQFASGAPCAGCHHDGCKRAGWGWAWLREQFEGPRRQPRADPAPREPDPPQPEDDRRPPADDAPPPTGEDGDEDEDAGSSPGQPKVSQATMLVRMALARAELWRTPDGDLFASVDVDGHREHLRLGSKDFKHWLAHLALVMMDRAAGGGTLRDALGALEGLARYQGAEHRTFIRIAAVDERIYIDLADERWRAVEIDRNGWRIVDSPPVRFERRNAMAPLPVPTSGGSLAELRDHVRIADESWALVLGWLVGALAPRGPFPVLVLRGQHGAGKSHGARRVRSLVDPSIAPIRCEPREPRDLIISARASHVVCLDNLSSVPSWLSDGLCRLATGGGYAARVLYTDADELVIDVQRPTILTGITDVVTAPDLLDRSLLVELEAIAPEDRETERRLDERWRDAQPRILGALYSAVSMALARRDTIEIERLPRLADWASWATAAEPALGLKDGAVIKALEGQAEEATEIALDASIIARPLCSWIQSRTDPVWTGTAAELHTTLTQRADLGVTRDKAWPKTARGLAGALARIAPALAAIGVRAERLTRGSGGVRDGRGWRVERLGAAS